MRIFGREADAREEAIRDGTKIGYFGSWTVGEEVITIHPGGGWWTGLDLSEPQPTMSGRELTPPRWVGSRVLKPGR